MIKLNFLLLLALVVSSVFLVNAQHDNRLLFSAIAKENALKSALESEGKRLLLARQGFVTPTRIAADAKRMLGMGAPSLGVIEYVPRNEDELRHFEAQVPGDVLLVNDVVRSRS
ncbi:MAG: cell division protein FtsL [Saezia sp.]